MTREEAADLLDNLIGMVEDNQENDYDEALKMAIEALSVPDTNVGDIISRQKAIDVALNDNLILLHMDSVKDGDIHRTKRAISRLLASLPSAQPEIIRCKDCKHHEDEELGMVYCPNQVGGWVSEDFFCKDGERRESDE